MKRFGVYISTLILLVSMTGGFLAPQHLFAVASDVFTSASTGETSIISKQELLAQGNLVFETFLSELAQRQANPKQFDITKNLTPANLTLYLDGVQKYLIPSIKNAQTGFAEKLNTPSAPSTNPYADYTAALEFAKTSINNDQQKNSSFYTSAMRQEVTSISKRIFDESQKQQNLLISTGNANAALTLQQAVGVQTTQQAKIDQAKTCSLFGMSSIKDCLDVGLTWLIKNTLLQIGGFLVWLAANMFNHAIRIGILEFSTWAPDALYGIWIIVRQIISLIIIFVGLYLGFMYILGKGEQFARFIPWLVAFALFVNFSYPLARTAIDISNIVSLNIYTSTMGSGILNAPENSPETAGAVIMAKLGLQSLALSATATDGKDMLGAINSLPGALLAVCFVFYTAYILFMVTWIMVMRTAVLVFLTIASPLLLVDAVLPVLGEKAKMLRKIFLEQLVVAPIFMTMLALTLKFLDVFNSGPLQGTGGANGVTSGALSTGAGSVTVFFNLTMMLVMLWIMIKVTKSTAGAVGTFATDMIGKTVGGVGLGVATGGLGLVGRKTLGMAATAAKDRGWVKEGSTSVVGRGAYALTNTMANSTYDLRNSTTVAGGMDRAGFGKGLLGMGGMGSGTGAKLGYEGQAKKKLEELQARGGRIKTKYERDMYNKDGEVIARKGDIDPEGLATKERFYNNNGGALFLSKKQKEDLQAPFIDESSAKDLENYKKKDTKEQREAFKTSLKQELDGLKQNGQGSSAQAQGIARSLFEITKQEQDAETMFIKQLEKEFRIYTGTAEDKKKNYLARLDKEMSDAVLKMEAKSKEVNTPSNTTSSPKTAEVLDQNNPNAPFPKLYTEKELEEAKNKQQTPLQKTVTSSENRAQNTPGAISVTNQPFNVETMSFSEKAAKIRADKQAVAKVAVEADFQATKVVATKPNITPVTDGVSIPSPTISAPTTQPANDPGVQASPVNQ